MTIEPPLKINSGVGNPIAEHNPALATLLAGSIRTGTFCSYTPDSRLPASWQL